ncbi:MAG: HAD family hydrolase [Ardenticatenaceae bacterium]|nr:HAD family hydrolase [Ardenticatenaceae bacterium]MCB9443849.1 HAD family hydrolase [Ardenticatenaceae bacterium]
MPETIPFSEIEAILFDLDGTLINTDDDAVARLEVKLRPFLRRRAPRIARWLMMKAETPGNALITLLDILHLDEASMGTTDRLRRRRGVYAAHEFSLIPGVGELLLSLQGRYKVALVTTRSRFHIDAFLQQFPVETAVFTTTCGLQDTRRLKPHPAPVRLAAQRLGVPVEKCVMVGDTTVDVKSGRRAGAWSVGVLCGFGELGELERTGAHLVLESTADLLKHLP